MKIKVEGKLNEAQFRVMERAMKALNRNALGEMVKDAGQIVVENVRQKVRSRAKRATGKLESAVTMNDPEFVNNAVEVGFGWEALPVKKRPKSAFYRDRRRKSTQKYRSVSTVDDYARILEYSPTRKLRHMEEGFSDKADEATAMIQSNINTLIDEIFSK